MSQLTDTLEETAKQAGARIADTARVASERVEGASRVASQKVTSAYGTALNYALTGLKMVPTVTSALGYLGLQRKRNHTLGYVASFSAGLVVGAGAGLLFAPRSGRELRETLWGYLRSGDSDKAKQEVVNAANEVVDQVEQKASKVVETAKDIAHKAEQKAKNLADDAQHAAGKTADKVQKAAEKTADKVQKATERAQDALS